MALFAETKARGVRAPRLDHGLSDAVPVPLRRRAACPARVDDRVSPGHHAASVRAAKSCLSRSHARLFNAVECGGGQGGMRWPAWSAHRYGAA